jgi:hypothetical protein
VPPVASEATTHAFKPTLPSPARTAQNPDQSQDSPFASLLADGTQASGDPPAQSAPASGDKNAPTAGPDLAQPPVKGTDAVQSSNNANSVAADILAVIVTAASAGIVVSADKAGFDVKTSEQTAAGNGAKPAGDGKPADGLTPDDPAAVAANGPVQTVPIETIMPVAAVVPAPMQVPGTNAPTAPGALAQPAAAAVAQAVPDSIAQSVPDEVPQTNAGGVTQAAPMQVPGTITPTAPGAITQPATAAVSQAVPDSIAQGVPDEAPQTKSGGVAQAAPAIDLQAPPAIVLQAAPVIAPQTPPAAVPQAGLAAKRPATVATAAPIAESADFAASQADTGKPAGDSNSTARTSFASQADGKAPATAGDADKPAVSRPHDEAAASPHHTATAETPPAIAANAQAATPKAAVDAVQQAALTPPSHDAAPAAANPAAPAAPAPAAAIPLAGVAVEIAGKAFAGKNRFEIRLDPPELGRIEVRLDVGHDGHVTSTLIADRSDTLDLLRRDSAGLERALQDAGLKTSDDGLQFSLRDQSTGRDQAHTPAPAAAQLVVSDDALAAIDANSRNYGRRAGLGGGIDIRV